MNDTSVITSIVASISAIGGFLYWHFKTVNGFKDEIHRIELKLKELENRDDLQQQTINQLNELYPILKIVLDKISK